jgi:hypothetical protein
MKPANPDEMTQLANQMAALDKMKVAVEHVQRYKGILSMISEETLTSQQRLWLVGYEVLESKFAPGTKEAMFDAAQFVSVLEDCIPDK